MHRTEPADRPLPCINIGRPTAQPHQLQTTTRPNRNRPTGEGTQDNHARPIQRLNRTGRPSTRFTDTHPMTYETTPEPDDVVSIDIRDKSGNYVETVELPRSAAESLLQLGDGDITAGLRKAMALFEDAKKSMPAEEFAQLGTELDMKDDQWLASRETSH